MSNPTSASEQSPGCIRMEFSDILVVQVAFTTDTLVSTMIKNTVQVRIVPTTIGSGKLSIPDAMQQVSDLFELLSNMSDVNICWALNDAKLNSPFVVTGEPINTATDEFVGDSIDSFVRNVATTLDNLSSGVVPHLDISESDCDIYKRLLKRNLNGIEETGYDFGRGIEQIVIDSESAKRGLQRLEELSEPNDSQDIFAVPGYGSITGVLIKLGEYSRKLAVSIKEFNTNQNVWCQIEDEDRIKELGEVLRAKHVWEHKDVLVQGILHYTSNGKLSHIRDSNVTWLNRKPVSLDELHDPDFTEGLPSEEYLEQLRGD